MTALEIGLTISIVVLLMVLAAVARSRAEISRRATDLDERLSDTSALLEQTRVKLTETEIEAGRASTRAEAAEQRADEVRKEAATERERADAAEQWNARLTDELSAAHAAAAASQIDPAALGGLEAVRISRMWHDVVGADEPPPVRTDDPVEAAVGVLAEASREATGTAVEIRWERTATTPGALAVLLVRAAEELVAAARSADRATLEITDDDDHAVRLVLRTEPATTLPPDTGEALRATGWVVSDEPGEVVLRLGATADTGARSEGDREPEEPSDQF